MSLDQPAGFVKHQTTTRDGFLGGRLTIAQPMHGFRAGLDSVLLGAAVSPDSDGLLDLGCGVGTASLVALAHRRGRTAVLLDSDGDLLRLADENVASNGFADRAATLTSDIMATTSRTLIPRDQFSSVIANPPYFSAGRGTAPSQSRAGSRHMAAEALDHWVRTAAGAVAPRGEVIFIHVAEALPELLAAFARFGSVTVLPLLPRAGAAASRVLVRGIKGSHAPFKLLASRSFHAAEGGAFAPEFDAIFRGTACLDW